MEESQDEEDLTMEQIEKATDRDNYLSPEKAKEMGLIDSVIQRSSDR